MGAKKIYEAAVKVGSYQDRNGNEKAKWANVGSVLKFDDGGVCLLLDRHFNPAGVMDPTGQGGAVRISFFPPKEQGQEQPRRQAPQAEPDFDSELPF